jgi:transcriptional regulator with XRE-family HTH domain
MPAHIEDHTGARVARTRKLRRLTQQELADLAGVSLSSVKKIEQGTIQCSPAMTAALARALSVPPTDLTGQPYIEELRSDQLDCLIEPIREALSVYDLGPDPDVAPRPLHELAADAETLCELIRATDIKKAASLLPSLICEATSLAHASPSDPAWQTLASTYRTAYDVATKLGYIDLSAVALDRMEWAAQRASDAVLGGMRQYLRALAYLRGGQYRTGQRLVEIGLSTLAQADAGRERDVVTGQIHLGAAVLAARARNGAAAELHLMEADRFAERTGPAERVHWLSFGPTNVRVHRVSVLAELDQFPEAVQAASDLPMPKDWPPSRRAHHYAEVARAQVWTGRTDAAFKNLLQARKLAPQQTKYHPTVRETFATLARARRSTPDTMSNYGHWLGM